ncbi:hypothetical protein SAMN05421507_113201 [Lentzea jiangxiensis]|uniref:Uncharacterized protein n=2 Tax=Lentzea jiangxiensis TaxID=641025 RepID=A0A1H0V6M0_9PSEU|nr:hypothetical protein SAMN05421507_113201 [Lentzea jiangxiensis]
MLAALDLATGKLGGTDHRSRELVDKVLLALAEDGAVMFTPEMNQRLLTPMDRHCALWIGGEFKHLMRRL